jgi:HAMP domain-containing protein
MKIRKKVSLGFLVIMLLLIAGAGITIYQFVTLNQNNRIIMAQNKQYNEAVLNMQEALNLYDYAIVSLISDTANKPNEIVERADSLYTLFIDLSETLNLNKEDESIITKLKDDFIHFRKEWIVSLITAPNIKFYMTSKEKEFRVMRNSLNKLMLSFQSKLLIESEILYEQYKRALAPGIVTIITSLILIIIFNILLGRLYINPLIRITQAVSKFHYKKTFNVEIETNDEIGELAKSIEELTKTMKR